MTVASVLRRRVYSLPDVERMVEWGLFLTLPVERIITRDVAGFTVRPIYAFMGVFLLLHWRRVPGGFRTSAPLVLILGAAIVSLAGSSDLGRSLAYGAWAGFTVLFAAAAVGLLVDEPERIRRWARLYVLTGAVWGAAAVLQWIGALHFTDRAYAWLGEIPRVQGPTLEPSSLSFYLVPPLVLSLTGRRWIWTVLIVAGLMASTGRTGLLGAIVGGVLLLAAVGRPVLTRVAVAAATALVTFGLMSAIPEVGGRLAPGLIPGPPAIAPNTAGSYGGFVSESTDLGEASSISPRLQSWRRAWNLFGEEPLTGAGVGGFGSALHERGFRLDVPVSRIRTTNLWLEVPSELGVLGLAALLSWAAWPLPALWRRVRGDPCRSAVAIAYLACLPMLAFVQTWWVPSRWFPWLLAAPLAVIAVAAYRRGGPVVRGRSIPAMLRGLYGVSSNGGGLERIRARGALALMGTIVGVLVLAGLALAALARRGPDLASQFPPPPPNVVVIITDDQRADHTLEVMPAVRRLFYREGWGFSNAYAATPVCCPSRATIFTGREPHNHGVRTNRDADKLDQQTTLQRYLRGAGYRTAYFGKYLNLWNLRIGPPHFDRFGIQDDRHFGAHVNLNGAHRRIPGYSTDWVGERARDFIEAHDATTDPQPFLLFVAPFAPHLPPTPEPRYAGAAVPGFPGSPAVRERDLRDKPQFLRRAARARREQTVVIPRQQERMLKSVDDLVAKVFAALRRTREDRNTLAIFTSDNGYLWGEHGLSEKSVPYLPSVRVPLALRWPGVLGHRRVERRPVSNVDIATTIYQAARVLPRNPLDGRSLFSPRAHERILTQQWSEPGRGGTPDWASLLAPSYHYIEYYDRARERIAFREYYDLRHDPWELRNLLGDGVSANDPPAIPRLSARLAKDRRCAGPRCP